MTYKLKSGEYVNKDGKLCGWTGLACDPCGATGRHSYDNVICMGCGGTGEEHGTMPVQPIDLPPPGTGR